MSEHLGRPPQSLVSWGRRLKPCLVLVLMTPVAASADGSVTSAPIDYSVYRAGEVNRLDQQFEAWQLTCDEIKRLGRKFCSLRGIARADDGTIIAALTISTDDLGRPAALFRLPFGTVLSSGLNVRRKEASAKRKATVSALRPTVCDDGGCEVLWPIVAEDIRTLTSNEPVRIAFRMTRPPLTFGPLLASMVPIEGAIQTAGFAAALQASMAR